MTDTTIPETYTDLAVARVITCAKRHGWRRIAKRAGVPYSTLLDWRDRMMRPSPVEFLGKVEAAAHDLLVNEKPLSWRRQQFRKRQSLAHGRPPLL